MTEKRTHHDELQEEVREIFDVLTRQHPERSTFDLWNEALSLHRVRYEKDVLALDEDGSVVNLGRIEDLYSLK